MTRDWRAEPKKVRVVVVGGSVRVVVILNRLLFSRGVVIVVVLRGVWR